MNEVSAEEQKRREALIFGEVITPLVGKYGMEKMVKVLEAIAPVSEAMAGVPDEVEDEVIEVFLSLLEIKKRDNESKKAQP